jgi:type II secretory pathway component PulK
MWIAFGLVTVAIYLGHSMHFEYRGASQFHAGHQAEQAIDGALRYFKFVLMNSTDAGQIPDPLNYSARQLQIGEATVYMIGRSGGEDNLNSNIPTLGPVDEASKININLAPYEVLMQLPMITPEFAAAIVDWRDEDDELTENGAEASMYTLLDNAYNIKNSPFETLEELRLVYGATTEMLYGEDINQNGILDPNENDGNQSPPMDNADGVLDFGILEYLTVHAAEPEETENDEDDQNNGGNNNPTGGGGAARLQQQPPPGTGDDESAETGFKVNVNTASAVVLSCLPGMNLSLAQQVVAARTGNAEVNPTLDWAREVIDADTWSQVEPYLTDKSYQFSLDLAAVGRNGLGYRRVRYVIDNSSGTPVVVYRRDMSRFGWALGETLRQQLSTQARTGNRNINMF